MSKMIGIVGGVGTFAGIDLLRKIYKLTDTRIDQDHLPVALVSDPHKVADRTLYLEGKVKKNPGIAIAKIITSLSLAGAEIIGIPCNSAHSPVIFNEIVKRIPEDITLLNLIEEVGSYLTGNFPKIKKAGVLGTNGTYLSNVYTNVLSALGIETIYPEVSIQRSMVHPAIYNTDYGIKAFSDPVSDKARKDLLDVAVSLNRQGAEAIILGCSEIPLAIHETTIGQSMVIDSTLIFARALISKST